MFYNTAGSLTGEGVSRGIGGLAFGAITRGAQKSDLFSKWLRGGAKGGFRRGLFARVRNFERWVHRGSEYDEFFFKKDYAERMLYFRGQKTFGRRFWTKNKNILESFTSGKRGSDYVEGVIKRGRYLKANHPIISSSANIIPFLRGIDITLSTGPDPMTRKLLMKMTGIR